MSTAMPRFESVRTWVLQVPLPRTHVVGRESFNNLIGVTLTDSEGAEGTGFSFVVDNEGAGAVKAMLDDVVVPEVLGRHIHEGALLWHELIEATARIGRGVSSLAIGALDTAVWDLNARRRGLSLADHIGRVRSSVPAYASGQFAPTLATDEVVEIARREVARGQRAIKIRVGMDLERDVDRVARLREALGPGVRLMCDANERLNLPDAIWLVRHLERHDVYWLEEPLPAHDVGAYVELVRATSIPIAAGEHLQSVADFRTFVAAGAAHIFQPDIGQIAGVTEFLRIAGVVREAGYALAPHFLPELHIHLVAAFPNAIYLEQFPWAEGLLETPLRFADGHVHVPDVLGHGVRFTAEAQERYVAAATDHHA